MARILLRFLHRDHHLNGKRFLPPLYHPHNDFLKLFPPQNCYLYIYKSIHCEILQIKLNFNVKNRVGPPGPQLNAGICVYIHDLYVGCMYVVGEEWEGGVGGKEQTGIEATVCVRGCVYVCVCYIYT